MESHTAQISNPKIAVRPSNTLKQYLTKIKIVDGIPSGIRRFIFKNPSKADLEDKNLPEVPYLLNSDDRQFIKSLNLNLENLDPYTPINSKPIDKSEKLLYLADLHWLYEHIHTEDIKKTNERKTYLHELLIGSEIILPLNEKVPRNEELELRCRKLKAEQENKQYVKMTKNVDSVKKHYPEDTISYQLKQMNRSLLAILQFIFSVAAGFAFGFIGIELIIGNLDFGFRLLLGIICALIIALAELYFLAKTLNEEIQFEAVVQNQYKGFKLD